MFRRQSIIDGDDAQIAFAGQQPANAIMAFQAADDKAAAMEKYQPRLGRFIDDLARALANAAADDPA